MDIPEPKRRPFRITDPKQMRIHERLLRLVDPCAAAFYHDAVELMVTRPPYQAFTHLVAHLIRDVQSAILDIIEPLSPDPGAKRGTTDAHKLRVVRACNAVGLDETHQVVASWIEWCGGENTQGFHKRAHRVTAGTPRPVDDEFLAWWYDVQYVFDAVLDRQETCFLKYVPTLDRLLAIRVPTRRDVKALRTEVPSSFVIRRYFFDRLDNPAWLPLLQKEGFFNHLPLGRTDEELGVIEYPSWPQVRYLRRMSSPDGDPGTACDIILRLPSTDNTLLMSNLAQAAAVMPVEHARRLISLVTSWIPRLRGMAGIDDLGHLAVRLANAGCAEHSLQLCQALLQVQPTAGLRVFGHREVDGVVDSYHFEKVITECVPGIIADIGEPVLAMLCAQLDQAIAITASDYTLDTGEDYLHISCPRVESASRGYGDDITHMLIAAVRDGAMHLLVQNCLSADRLLDILSAKRWSIFHRISLHLLRVGTNVNTALITKALLDEALFAESEGRQHEYRLLLKERFGDLQVDQQLTILGWIDHGPDVSYYRSDDYSQQIGRAVTDEEISSYADEWRLERLEIIADHLTGDWPAFYLDLKQRCDSVSRRGQAQLQPAPRKTTQELVKMGIPELVDYLNTLAHDDRCAHLDPEDGSRTLEQIVSDNPEHFLLDVDSLTRLRRPVYTDAVLTGLLSALNNQKHIPWRPAFRFCDWLMRQPEPRRREVTVDGRTVEIVTSGERYYVAGILNNALSGQDAVDLVLRDAVWAVIELLIAGCAPGSSELPTGEIDSILGDAVRAVIHYAIWVKEQGMSGENPSDAGFTLVPEAREVVESIFSSAIRQSPRAYRALGETLPYLIAFDEHWCRANLRNVFPRGKRHHVLRTAAWNTYLKFHQPCTPVFRVLKSEYRYAIRQLGVALSTEGPFGDSADDLAEHLMTYYWWGRIDLRPENSLVKEFFQRASDKLRASAIRFIGWSFWRADEEIPHDVIARLVLLWNWRMEQIRSAQAADEFKEELPEFGWWVTCGKFPHEWVLTHLREVIRLAGRINMQGDAFESMANDMDTYPDLVLDCLEAILDASTEWDEWKLSPIVKPAQQILGAALENESMHARALALANKFGSKDYITEFRDLADHGPRE